MPHSSDASKASKREADALLSWSYLRRFWHRTLRSRPAYSSSHLSSSDGRSVVGRKAGLSASECCCLEPALTWLKLHHLAICRMDANLLDQTLTCCGLVDNISRSRVDAEAAWSTRPARSMIKWSCLAQRCIHKWNSVSSPY